MPKPLLRLVLFLLIILPAAAGCVQSPALGPAPTAATNTPITPPTAEATATPADIIAPKATATAEAIAPVTGVLQGHVSIGPLHGGPVREEDINATVPSEVYAERPVLVYAEDGMTLLHQVTLDSAGDYSIALPAGRYVVGITLPGRDRSEQVPAAIEIHAGETTLLDISIDTGLR